MTEPVQMKEKVDDLFKRYVEKMNLSNQQFYLFADFLREFMNLYHELVTDATITKVNEVFEERAKF